MVDALRARGLLAISVWAMLGACAAVTLIVIVRQRPGPCEAALLVLTGGVYLLLLHRLDIIQERIHLVEYGVVGGRFYGASHERWGDRAGEPGALGENRARPR